MFTQRPPRPPSAARPTPDPFRFRRFRSFSWSLALLYVAVRLPACCSVTSVPPRKRGPGGGDSDSDRFFDPLGFGCDLRLRFAPRPFCARGADRRKGPHLYVVVRHCLTREPCLAEQVLPLQHLKLCLRHLLGLAFQVLDAAGGTTGVA